MFTIPSAFRSGASSPKAFATITRSNLKAEIRPQSDCASTGVRASLQEKLKVKCLKYVVYKVPTVANSKAETTA